MIPLCIILVQDASPLLNSDLREVCEDGRALGDEHAVVVVVRRDRMGSAAQNGDGPPAQRLVDGRAHIRKAFDVVEFRHTVWANDRVELGLQLFHDLRVVEHGHWKTVNELPNT